MKEFVLITSAGRTGTNWLGNHLDKFIDNSQSCHEPDIFEFRKMDKSLQRFLLVGPYNLLFGKLTGRGGSRNINNNYISGSITEEQALASFLKARSYLDKLKSKIYIESNPKLFGMPKVLANHFNYFKLVVIIRDPRTWIRSQVRKESLFTKSDLIQRLGLNRFDPSPEGCHGTFSKLAYRYQAIYNFLQDQMNEVNSLIIRFEDLFGETSKPFNKLIKFIDSSAKLNKPLFGKLKRQKVNKLERNDFPNWPEWDTKHVRILDRICGELMSKYNYGKEESWIRKSNLK